MVFVIEWYNSDHEKVRLVVFVSSVIKSEDDVDINETSEPSFRGFIIFSTKDQVCRLKSKISYDWRVFTRSTLFIVNIVALRRARGVFIDAAAVQFWYSGR
jgi:hypothetical protein